jgi:anti-anti-sigma factor
MTTSTIDVQRNEPGPAVVAVIGEHDLSTAAELGRVIGDAGTSGVVVDLGQTEFIDSAVLRVLIVAQQQAAESGRAFVISLGPTSGHAVRRLFELTGLDRRLVIAPDVAAAVALASNGQGAESPPA